MLYDSLYFCTSVKTLLWDSKSTSLYTEPFFLYYVVNQAFLLLCALCYAIWTRRVVASLWLVNLGQSCGSDYGWTDRRIVAIFGSRPDLGSMNRSYYILFAPKSLLESENVSTRRRNLTDGLFSGLLSFLLFLRGCFVTSEAGIFSMVAFFLFSFFFFLTQ